MPGTAVATRAIVTIAAAVGLVLPAAASAYQGVDPQTLENQGVTELIVKRDDGLSARWAEPNAPVKAFTNDSYFSSQWALAAPAPGSGGIDAVDALAQSTGAGVTVGIVDTGADLTSAELQPQLTGSGYDFVNDDASPDDDNGHGSHVSGIVAAVANNSFGIAGVAPSAKL